MGIVLLFTAKLGDIFVHYWRFRLPRVWKRTRVVVLWFSLNARFHLFSTNDSERSIEIY